MHLATALTTYRTDMTYKRRTREEWEVIHKAELTAVIEFLTEPKSKQQIMDELPILNIHVKLLNWTRKEVLRVTKVRQKFLYERFDAPVNQNYQYGKLDSAIAGDELPIGKSEFITVNGNSTIYRFTNYARPKGNKSRDKVYVAGNSLSNFV